MNRKFNNGKPYHGSDAVIHGKLRGATDTDYLYIFCPICQNNHIVRLLDYEVTIDQLGNPYDDMMTSKSNRGFTIAFKFYCERCGHTDFFKMSNTGWQGGNFEEVPTIINNERSN